jgi:hypothetical protein
MSTPNYFTGFPNLEASAGASLVSDTFVITMIAGEDLTPGYLVEITGDFTVKKCQTMNSTKVKGITLTGAKNGSPVSIACRGLVRATAWGNIAAGDQIGSASGGTSAGYIISDNTSKNTTILGQALQAIASGGVGIVALW